MPLYLVPVDKGRRIVLDKAVVFIGRHPECDVILGRSRKVSRRHCCIAQVNESWVIRDLGSMNGVRVNGERVRKEAALEVGDEVTIGDVEYVLKAKYKPASEKPSLPRKDAPEEDDADPEAAPLKNGDVASSFSDEYCVPLSDSDADFDPVRELDAIYDEDDEDDVLLVEDSHEF